MMGLIRIYHEATKVGAKNFSPLQQTFVTFVMKKFFRNEAQTSN